MGLATIDPHSQKEHTKINKIPKFGVNRVVLTEIQAYKNVKNLQRNAWKLVRIYPHFHTFLCNFFNSEGTI